MTEEDRGKNKKLLIEILDKTEKRLRQIVLEDTNTKTGRPRFRKEFLPMLSGLSNGVAAHFQRSQETIMKDELNWEYLENAGLTGQPLEYKAGFLNETLKERTVSRFFKVAKSILGSLKKAIPHVEFIIEFIELVEAAMNYGRG